MNLTRIWLIAAQALTCVISQPQSDSLPSPIDARYVAPRSGILILYVDVVYDVCEGYLMNFGFGKANQPIFTDGPYRLRRNAHNYTIDFEAGGGNVSVWYENVIRFFPEAEGFIQEGEMTNIGYDSSLDEIYMNIAGELYEMYRNDSKPDSDVPKRDPGISSLVAGKYALPSPQNMVMHFDVSYDESDGYSVTFRFGVINQPLLTDGPYKLRHCANDVYPIDFEAVAGGDVKHWYENTVRIWPEADGRFQRGDLMDLVYTKDNNDIIFVKLLGVWHELFTSGFDLIPGVFEAIVPGPPSTNITFEVHDHGPVFLQVRCDERRTSFEIFLLRRYGNPYVYYTLEWSGRATVDHFLDQVRQVCPDMNVQATDLGQVIFEESTQNSVHLELGGPRVAHMVSRNYTPMQFWYDHREPVI